MKKDYRITCPNCGRQYMPGEIFIPKHLVGYPQQIERDPYGKIIDCGGIDIDPYEDYTCDNCGKKLSVYCDMRFSVKINDKADPDTFYKTKLKTGLTLSED